MLYTRGINDRGVKNGSWARNCLRASPNLRPPGRQLGLLHQGLKLEAVPHTGAHVILTQKCVHEGGKLWHGGGRGGIRKKGEK